ncbi:DUF3106 domain-containing protein [Lysobacter cavernae]|uniref:DUF3106 domain-containing protein n=1 Tax=Lysobacter cavernae TaxID=1685901 RepID=A0ABV7RNA8_9GAMM
MRRSERRRTATLGLALGCALAVLPAYSAPPAELLQSLARLPPAAHAALQRQLLQWNAWTPQQHAAYAQRAAAWDALPRAERDTRRERFLAWQALPAAERARVQDATAWYAALPPQLQQAWRAQFDALDRSQRRGWLLGPELGADYAVLQPLLAQVPAEQHAPLLQALRAMTPTQRADLGVLVQRTPPQRREALRSGLLAAYPGHLGDWLWQQLQQ